VKNGASEQHLINEGVAKKKQPGTKIKTVTYVKIAKSYEANNHK